MLAAFGLNLMLAWKRRGKPNSMTPQFWSGSNPDNWLSPERTEVQQLPRHCQLTGSDKAFRLPRRACGWKPGAVQLSKGHGSSGDE